MAIGGIGIEVIDAAAQIAVLGLDPFLYLNNKDFFERTIMEKLAEKMDEYLVVQQERLAKMIANEVAKRFP